MNETPKGFSLWITSSAENGQAAIGPRHLAEALKKDGWLVESFDLDLLLETSGKDQQAAVVGSLGMTLNRLNRHGVLCVVAAGEHLPDGVLGGIENPGNLLHLWCGKGIDGLPKLAFTADAFHGGGQMSNGNPVGFVLAEVERRGWLETLEPDEAEDDPTVLPRLRSMGLL